MAERGDTEWYELVKMYSAGPDHRDLSASRIIGAGEMPEMIRKGDWAATPLGGVETWSDTLVTTLNLLLASSHPMFLWWGPHLIQFYNDSFRLSVSGDEHRATIGQRGVECWPKIWPSLSSKIDAVMIYGISTFHANQRIPVRRNGRLVEAFWTYSYSPVRGNNDAVQGALMVCTETTEQVLSERRLRTLRAIKAHTPAATVLPEFQQPLPSVQTIARSLLGDPADLPFAALYLWSADGSIRSGCIGGNGAFGDHSRWPLARLKNATSPLVLQDLQDRFTNLVCEPWPEPVTSACLLPLFLPGSSSEAVLVLGISPRLAFDQGYRMFFELVAARVASLLQNHILEPEHRGRMKTLEQEMVVLAAKDAVLDLPQDSIIVQDMQDRVLFWNGGAEVMYGWLSKEAMGRNTFELLKTEFLGIREAMKSELLRQGHWEGEASQQKRNGATVVVSSRSALQRDLKGNPARILTINNDITAHKQNERNLQLLTERLSLATAVAKIGVWELDIASNTLTWDATMFEIYGFQPVVPMPYRQWSSAVLPDDLPLVEATLRKVIDDKGRGSAEFRIVLSDGSVKNISTVESAVLEGHAKARRVIGVNIDVTERTKAEETCRKNTAEKMHWAEHDFLTGLPNRMLLNDRVDQAILWASRQGKQVAVLFLDLDGFKNINDSLGHSIGDKLLQSIAKGLATRIRSSDTVSRQGGDEFIVLLSDLEHPEATAIAAATLLKAVAEPHAIEGHDLHVTASIGISIYPSDGLDAETLIKNADMAMYQAKENSRGGYKFFKQDMNVRAVRRQAMEEDLRRALERRQFSVHYQPKVNLKTGEITGVEALLRWTHPTRGPISPAQFMPVAEDSGLILPIGKWLLREACQQARAWIDAALPLTGMAVNISAAEFRNKNFPPGVLAILEETGLDPRFLELELTEGVLMKHAASTERILKTLRAKGLRLAVDDFGTGYSSLSCLRKFPIDALKIDQSLIRQITTAPAETSIISAIIGMGRNLDLRVVAEGVETEEEMAFLKAHECDEGQGYYFGKPVGAEQFADLLKTGMPGATSLFTLPPQLISACSALDRSES